VRVTLDVRPNPELRGVVVAGANVLPVRVIQDAFAGQARIARCTFRVCVFALVR
jgi:hypothetical protein